MSPLLPWAALVGVFTVHILLRTASFPVPSSMCNLAISAFVLVIYQITQILSLDLPRFGSGQIVAGHPGGVRLSKVICCRVQKADVFTGKCLSLHSKQPQKNVIKPAFTSSPSV